MGPGLSRSGKGERAKARTWGQTTPRQKQHVPHNTATQREGKQSKRLVETH